MPMELLKEFIGQTCTVSLFNEISGVQGVILAVEENWIKLEEKKRIRIINGLRCLAGKRESLPEKKHGNIPL